MLNASDLAMFVGRTIQYTYLHELGQWRISHMQHGMGTRNAVETDIQDRRMDGRDRSLRFPAGLPNLGSRTICASVRARARAFATLPRRQRQRSTEGDYCLFLLSLMCALLCYCYNYNLQQLNSSSREKLRLARCSLSKLKRTLDEQATSFVNINHWLSVHKVDEISTFTKWNISISGLEYTPI